MSRFSLYVVSLVCLVGPSVLTITASADERSNHTNALAVALDTRVRKDLRVQAIESLGRTSFAEAGPALLSLLRNRQPQTVQLAAIAALGRIASPEVGPELTKRWQSLAPVVRDQTLPVLLAFPDRAVALLQAIKDGVIESSALSSAQVEFLSNHQDETVRKSALEVWPPRPAGERQQVVDSFKPALGLKGDITRGASIFEQRCTACHRLKGDGYALGPDLALSKAGGNEKMLADILDPSREIRPEFASYLIETKEDESLLGLVTETESTVTLRQPYGKETILNRADIRKFQRQTKSLMPEGLEGGLNSQDLADLIAYIETAELATK